MRFTRVDQFQGSIYQISGVVLRAGTMPDITIFTVCKPSNPNVGLAGTVRLLAAVYDLDGDDVADVVYEVLVDSQGAWRLDVATMTPVLGALPGGELPVGRPVPGSVALRDRAGNLSPKATWTVEVSYTLYMPIVSP